jgi:signal transduction histidine kinase
MLEAGRGLKTLLDDIIALATHSEDPITAPEEGCDAAQAARTVARLLQPNAWEKRLRLSVNIAQGLPRVACDPRLLRRILLKVAGNAIKFTERGNVEIALDETKHPEGRQMVRFAITDTGPGIPAHLLSAIFEPFSRDEGRSAQSGAGVGLSVAKHLVECGRRGRWRQRLSTRRTVAAGPRTRSGHTDSDHPDARSPRQSHHLRR